MRNSNLPWYAVALLVYPVLTTIALAIGAALGWITFPSPIGPAIRLLSTLFVASLIPQLVKNLFEELGVMLFLATGIVLHRMRNRRYVVNA